jgi:hypothetical protein
MNASEQSHQARLLCQGDLVAYAESRRSGPLRSTSAAR